MKKILEKFKLCVGFPHVNPTYETTAFEEVLAYGQAIRQGDD